jgi:hypothetical protein
LEDKGKERKEMRREEIGIGMEEEDEESIGKRKRGKKRRGLERR